MYRCIESPRQNNIENKRVKTRIKIENYKEANLFDAYLFKVLQNNLCT